MKKWLQSIEQLPSHNPNPVLRISSDGTVLYANKAAGPILAAFGTKLDHKLKGRWKQTVTNIYYSMQSVDMEIENGPTTFSVVFMPIEEAGCVILYGRDITDRKKVELEHKVLSTAIEHSVNIVFITDADGIIKYTNPMFETVTGYTNDEAIGQRPSILSSDDTPGTYYEDLWSTILGGKTWRNILKNKKKDGDFYWCNTVISPIQDEKGRITHFLSVQEDVTERMASRKRLQYLSSYDEITGLMNRARFMKLMGQWMDSASGPDKLGVLFLMDIDHFKFLNDTYGHAIGDEFLRRFAEIIKTTLKDFFKEYLPDTINDTLIGRTGGDQFVVFMPSVDIDMGMRFAEDIRRAVEVFRFKQSFGALTVSTGVVEYPAHGSEETVLFTRVDAAMYRAKELGRNRYHLYRPEDRDLEKMHSRIQWKERILKALKEDRFEPWFQPILDLKTGFVHHYEALARMRDTDGKILLPGSFIEVAERFGIIGDIDRVIIEKTMEIQAAGGKDNPYSFSVNLSGMDLGDKKLLSFLKSALKRTGANPGSIVFEITETAAVGYIDNAIEFIESLKELGCRFALDDFGVGFTSFMYLKRMDVDFIKIDGSFIRKLNEDKVDQLFVKSMTEVANGLNIMTVAEFVENEETLVLLKKFGVDFAQGYFVGKPAPALTHNDIKDIKKPA